MKKIDLHFCLPKIKFTTGDIISCKDFCYGISMIDRNNEVLICNSEKKYQSFLRQYIKAEKGLDAYDLSRGNALFLVLSMELVETTLPDDVEEDSHYLGLNVKCIRLKKDNSLVHDAERIFFTLYHPMSCLDLNKSYIDVIKHLDLPIYWNEQSHLRDGVEKPF